MMARDKRSPAENDFVFISLPLREGLSAAHKGLIEIEYRLDRTIY
jgi:hypothetical protein